ncbi:hypothetical protein A0H81_06268 [Grifola frondosa]|uniref:Uncharacterized protein n=1 Tax=Grifola frondosa TaxID=5627 RepID=A0A1C7MB02_GRIFR|nr:hypothetical protein A0H81_06268 [Grifola frondosa]
MSSRSDAQSNPLPFLPSTPLPFPPSFPPFPPFPPSFLPSFPPSFPPFPPSSPPSFPPSFQTLNDSRKPGWKPRNAFEEHLEGVHPSWFPPDAKLFYSDKDFDELFRSIGVPEDELAEKRRLFDNNVNEMMASCGGKIEYVGFKPEGNAGDVQFYAIPDCELSIRIWTGGMDRHGQWLLDFFNRTTSCAVNAPDGFGFYPIQRPGFFTMSGPDGRLPSWEETAYGHQATVPGEERFSVPEGSWWALKRPGKEDFCFVLPTSLACCALGATFFAAVGYKLSRRRRHLNAQRNLEDERRKAHLLRWRDSITGVFSGCDVSLTDVSSEGTEPPASDCPTPSENASDDTEPGMLKRKSREDDPADIPSDAALTGSDRRCSTSLPLKKRRAPLEDEEPAVAPEPSELVLSYPSPSPCAVAIVDEPVVAEAAAIEDAAPSTNNVSTVREPSPCTSPIVYDIPLTQPPAIPVPTGLTPSSAPIPAVKPSAAFQAFSDSRTSFSLASSAAMSSSSAPIPAVKPSAAF